ncbi:TPA: PAS domain S-box protein [Candidatus Galligastranaerophilus gallistercoris]|nr:PAS domain S-box protein [Candidatus Galligastranaerophilus gallistercoris]
MNLFSIFNKPKKEDIFEIFPDGILIVSMDGKILDVNSKALKILGFSKMELTGSYFSQYIQGGSVLLNKLVQSGMLSVTKAANSNKEDIYVEVSAAKSDDNEKVYVSIRDITQSYKVQNMISGEYEIAKKIIDEKNKYLKGISGEIFSLLNSVTSFSKALNDGVGGELTDKQNKYVSIINKNSNELSYDLEKLFRYFEAESNLYQYEYKKFDLADLVTSIAKSYEVLFAKKKLNFTYDFSSFQTRSCYSDAAIIEILIKSILDISLKYTDIGSVSMNVGNPPIEFLQNNGYGADDESAKKQYALFEIKDSGLVLTPSILQNIFNPYYLDENANKKLTGAKLTYSLVYKHVKNLKGDMWVYSKPSQGTLACILLPMDKI